MSQLKCPECGAKLILKRSQKFNKSFYGCETWFTTKCPGSMSAHQNSNKPMGIPVDGETKLLRIEAHSLFDPMWKDGEMKRKDAYKWMAETLDIDHEKAHISMLDKETLKKLIFALKLG